MKTKTDQTVKEDKAQSGVEPKIIQYFHCGKCLDKLREDDFPISPQEYSQLSVGATEEGIQIWCDRHDCEVEHISVIAIINAIIKEQLE